MPYTVRISRHRDRITVHVSGELDIETAPALRDCLEGLVEQGDTTIELDLRWLTFCDSTGISAFVHGYEFCRAAGGRLSVVGERGSVARILDMTGIRTILAAVPTEPRAVEVVVPASMDGDGSPPVEAPGTRSGTLRLEIDMHDEDSPGRSIVAAPSQDDLAAALAALEGSRHATLTVVDGNGSYLTVVGGGGRYRVHIGVPDHDERRVLPDVVDHDLAAATVREFFHTGRPDPGLQWHRVAE